MSEETTYYDIWPNSIADIKYQLRQHSPVNKASNVFHGGTQWRLTQAFGYSQPGNLCYIVGVEVRLEGIYTLPRMANRSDQNKHIQAVFDQYFDALFIHEQGHKALWLQAGEEIHIALEQIPPYFMCDQIKINAQKRIRTIRHSYEKHNKRYDTDTGHGTSQGAKIP